MYNVYMYLKNKYLNILLVNLPNIVSSSSWFETRWCCVTDVEVIMNVICAHIDSFART